MVQEVVTTNLKMVDKARSGLHPKTINAAENKKKKKSKTKNKLNS